MMIIYIYMMGIQKQLYDICGEKDMKMRVA